MEKAYEAGEVTEEELLDGFLALGRAYEWMEHWDENVDWESYKYFERAKEGFIRLLGENSAKALNAAYYLVEGSDDEVIEEYRRLWEMAKVSLPDETVTFQIASDLGFELRQKGEFEDAKMFYLAALEGRRRVLGEDHAKTLAALSNAGTILHLVKDYEGALDYHQQALRGRVKVSGKAHPDTLLTILNIAYIYNT